MGLVYLARELRLDRPVAISCCRPTSRRTWRAASASCARRARQQPWRIQHRPIHSTHEVGEFVFFTMAYVAGETLAQRVAAGGPLAPEDAARLLAEVGEALAYAHARGVVHRDVKPDNILIERETGRALLTDFGSPTSVRPPAGRAARGRCLAAAAFMSPEQARGEAVDARSDVVLARLVAYLRPVGAAALDAATDGALLLLHITTPAPR